MEIRLGQLISWEIGLIGVITTIVITVTKSFFKNMKSDILEKVEKEFVDKDACANSKAVTDVMVKSMREDITEIKTDIKKLLYRQINGRVPRDD